MSVEKVVRLALLAAGTLWLFSRDKKMPVVQACFERFHDRIRLDESDENANLRDKRDIILDGLRQRLDLKFECFNQGSYAMHTGTVPPDGDYDIDVGLIFENLPSTYSDPVKLKVAVRDALKQGARRIDIRKSCVTIHYSVKEEPEYHVDLALYRRRSDGLLDIAKGKEFSKKENRFWEISNPQVIKEILCTRFKGEELRQYRRCVRYMKRWRDAQFSVGAPLSIALTVAAYYWFQPQSLGGNPQDLLALRNWTQAMLRRFERIPTTEGWHERLQILLPVEPKADLMSRMTKAQMLRFQKALIALHESLDKASKLSNENDSINLLACQFGAEFA